MRGSRKSDQREGGAVSDVREFNEEIDPKVLIVHWMMYGMTACQKPGPPGDWPEKDHRWSSDWNDVNCPHCLEGKEPFETFTISEDGKAITCKRCKRTSHNARDVENHYCGWCHVYHDDIWPPARHWWVENLDARWSPANFRLKKSSR